MRKLTLRPCIQLSKENSVFESQGRDVLKMMSSLSEDG